MSFKKILGHEEVIRLLKGQIAKERMAQTYLFAGPSGIGKKTLAIELTKALECQEARGGEVCDGCESCMKIGQGTFPDVLFLSPDAEVSQKKRGGEAVPRLSGQMGIDQIRTLGNWMALKPFGDRWKVGIVDQADRLTEEAAHACLKFLEEPPEKCIVVLIAAAPQRLPQTLLSRCHLVRCAPQGIERVAADLKERERLDSIQSTLLATWAGGRLGVALEFHRENRLAQKNEALNQLLSAWRKKILELPLGTAPRRELEETLEWWAAWWRDLLVLKLGGDPAWVIHQDRLDELKQIRESLPLETLLDSVERTYRVQEAIQRNASPRMALAALLSH